jgi:hypothetical protein
MLRSDLSLNTVLFGVLVLAGLGQQAVGQGIPVRVQQPVPMHPGPMARSPQPHQPPCWQEAGISKAAMDQRAAIQRRTRSEVEAVCAETSLTPQQRQQKIRQIHEQAKQEMDALVSPQQMESLKSCQMSRNHGGGHPGVAHPSVGGGHGPCGELPSGSNGPKPPNPTSPGAKPEPDTDN